MSRITRRSFVASAAATGLAVALPLRGQTTATSVPTTTQRKLRIGLIGVGGRGNSHVQEVGKDPAAEIVAICDVDSTFLAKGTEKFPTAAQFVDFRELIAKTPDLEAVMISTPDHTHAVASAAAMRAGKHVYCEKPLTHTIAEARELVQLANETKLVTQTGIQMHAQDNYRRVVELIQSGAIGSVAEVHIWNNRTRKPVSTQPVAPPTRLNYDLWLGPLTERPYLEGYHPFTWRYWWSFANGFLSDISPHLTDVAFWALDLQAPTRVKAKGHSPAPEVTARWITAEYEFAARGDKPPVKLNWYDLPHQPPMIKDWKLDEKQAVEGVMFIGSEGMLWTHFTSHALLPADKFKTFTPPKPTIPKSPGHQREWINACLKNDPTAVTAPFSYGALLTETALLGAISFRADQALEWDSANMRFKNAPEAQPYVRYNYRAGWTL